MSVFNDNDIEKIIDESLRKKILNVINNRDYHYDIFGQEIHKDDYIILLSGWGGHKLLKVICFNIEHEVFCKYADEEKYIAVKSKNTLLLNDETIKMIKI